MIVLERDAVYWCRTSFESKTANYCIVAGITVVDDRGHSDRVGGLPDEARRVVMNTNTAKRSFSFYASTGHDEDGWYVMVLDGSLLAEVGLKKITRADLPAVYRGEIPERLRDLSSDAAVQEILQDEYLPGDALSAGDDLARFYDEFWRQNAHG